MPCPERGLTSVWSFLTRDFGQPTKKEKQMTAQAGASFHEAVDWSSIDWTSVFRNVRRLQARIVKAMQQRRWGKVKALQRLLTHEG